MAHYALRGQVQPARLAEYRRRHRTVWSELLHALREAGWRHYSLFLDQDGLLVGFVEADDLAAAQAAVAATEVNDRWQREMAALFADPDAGAPDTQWRILEPVFDLGRLLAAETSPAPQGLRVEDHRAGTPVPGRPLPVAGSSRPRLSWTLPLVRRGQRQTAYQIVATLGADPRTSTPWWDSRRVESDRAVHVRWSGPELAAHDTVRWTVRTWDERGAASPWAEPAALITGPFTDEDWSAGWISVPATHAARTEFVLPAERVRHARLHLAAQGVVRAYLDGSPINPDASDPSRTARSRAAVRSYDVTNRLAEAPGHVLAVAVGLGHHRKVLDRPRVRAELVVEFVNGRAVRIGTGSAWRHGSTPVVVEAPFYLEEHDARVGEAWSRVGFDDRSWEPVDPATGPVCHPDEGPPVRVVEELDAAPIGTEARGVVVFDAGRNVAARARVTLSGSAPGQRLEIVHGEKLDAAGRVDTLNIRLPDDADRERQLLRWTCAGGTDVAEAWFTVHGFRYVEVRGLAEGQAVTVTVRVLHSDVAGTGHFTSDDPSLDRLVDMAMRTQLNNTHAHPEDCPTREQSGWTGDASVSAEAALSHLDMAGVYRHWLGDVAADQRADGGVLGVSPHVLPDDELQPADPVWGSAFTEIPLQHWRHIGDASLLTRLLPGMRRWADWQLGTLVDGVVRRADISYGADWLAPVQTPPVVLQTTAVLRSLAALVEIETVAGDPGEAERRRAQHAELTASARAAFGDPATLSWGNDSQVSRALALVTGLVADADERAAVQDALRADVHARGDRLSSGFAGTQAVVHALAGADAGLGGGRALLACVHQPEQPGIGAMLVNGPGTFWETWWIDDANAGVASLDHIGLGAPFAAWAWTHVAGIRPLSAGYREVAVAPRTVGPLRRARAVVDTVRGELDVSWALDGDRLTLELAVPVGVTAQVTLAGAAFATLTLDGTPAADEPLVRDEGPDGLDRRLLVPAGRYRFAATPVVVPPPPARREPEPVHVPATQWLSDGVPADGWEAVNGDTSVRVREELVVCTPVFHGPIPAPVLDVVTAPTAPGQTRWVRRRFDPPLDLTDARFVAGEVDLCFPQLPGRVLEPRLRVIGADGTVREAGERPLPVSWTRVAVDVDGWSGRSALSEVAVGLQWANRSDPARGAVTGPAPETAVLSFRIGRVGCSGGRRTW